MSAPTPGRRQRRLLPAFTGLVLLAALALGAYWGVHRWLALQAIDQEAKSGLNVEWEGLLARPGKVSIDYEIVDAASLGAALKRLGGVRTLSVGQGSPDKVQALLESMGEQPSLERLFVFNVALDHRTLPVLARLRSLKELALVPSDLSCESFPLLPELRNLDLAYSPLTDPGLARLLSCPKLVLLHAHGDRLTRPGILAATAAASTSPTVREVKLRGTKFPAEEATQIIEETHKQLPALQLDLRR